MCVGPKAVKRNFLLSKSKPPLLTKEIIKNVLISEWFIKFYYKKTKKEDIFENSSFVNL